MLAIGQWMPAQEIFRAFRYIRNHLEQHDSFVEMIQIIGGKPGAGIDVGGMQSGSPGLLIRASLARRRAIGSGGIENR
jgi:hypothetical protein